MKRKCLLKRAIVLSSVGILSLCAIYFGIRTEASNSGIARYGVPLSMHKPFMFASKGTTADQTIDDTWVFADPDSDYFGSAGSKTFVVRNADGTKYDTISVDVQPRIITPTVQIGNSESTVPQVWAGNTSRQTIGKYQHSAAVKNATGGTTSGGNKYTKGQSYNITATPSSNYKFKSWSDGNTSSSRNIVMGDNDITYTPEFEAAKTVTVATNSSSYGTVSVSGTPSGTVSGTSTTTGKFFTGDSYTITAAPKSGYTFTKWSDGNTSKSRALTMSTVDVSYTATFAASTTTNVTAVPNQYTVSVKKTNLTSNKAIVVSSSTLISTYSTSTYIGDYLLYIYTGSGTTSTTPKNNVTSAPTFSISNTTGTASKWTCMGIYGGKCSGCSTGFKYYTSAACTTLSTHMKPTQGYVALVKIK